MRPQAMRAGSIFRHLKLSKHPCQILQLFAHIRGKGGERYKLNFLFAYIAYKVRKETAHSRKKTFF